MIIEKRDITIRDLITGYEDKGDEGVTGFSGRLDIRPAYQREFVYQPKQRDAVIDTVRKGFPLNIMYWVKQGEDAYEILDGQQRTISLCEFAHDNVTLDWRGSRKSFDNLTEEEQEEFLNYTLSIYVCDGGEREKLEWFKTVNIAGVELTNQELLNAVYAGPWLADAKRYFSRPNCPAAQIAQRLIKGTPIRQEYLETALRWASEGDVEGYMADHQRKQHAKDLWLRFKSVIDWTDATFIIKIGVDKQGNDITSYRTEMKGVDWGALHRLAKGRDLDPTQLEAQVSRLMEDEDVSKKSGIYAYLITGEERHLNIRAFTPNQKREAYERQKGICARTGEALPIEEMEADHIRPWHEGGPTTAANCQMISKAANRTKSGK